MPEQKADIMKNKGLTIEIGRENQYVVEDITKEKIDSSFFASQYRESLAAVESYLKHLPESSDNSIKSDFGEDYPNNIIAFVGDRGSGKTSCMESVAKFLSNPKKDVTDYKTIISTKFYALDLIDPAFFDEEHNIVSLVVATLYRRFTENDKDLHNPNHDDNIKLYHQFAKVQNELEWILDNSSKDVDELDKLTNLSNTVSLKHDMLKLVNLFLKYMGKEDGILLLHIDDIDLNTQCADKMMESIRKYLILPNILILMSAKVEQLENVKQLAYVKEYKSLLDKEGSTGFTYAHINEMVDKFITKFLPQVHRVHMPILGYRLSSPLSIEENGHIETFERWKDSITNLIYKKAGILFYNDPIDVTKISRIVPTNLRELCQIVTLLYSLKDNDDFTNSDKLIHYYGSIWAKNHLTADMFSAIQEITDFRHYSEFNKNIIRQLCKVYSRTIQGWEKEDTDLRIAEALLIVDKYNQPDKITLGDVFGVISLLEEVHTESSDRDFFFFIKASYTFLFSRLYKQKFKLGNNEYLFIENKGCIKSSLKYAYMPFIGGNFINSNIVETVAPDKDGNKRSFREIYMKNVSSSITELRNEYGQFGENDRNNQNADYNKFLNKLHILEIIVLCLGRNVEPRYDRNFRKVGDSKYFDNIEKRKRVYFDVNAYMYNVLDIENAYNRVGNDLQPFVKDIPDSMYNILQYTLRQAEEDEKLRIAIDAETIINLTKELSHYRNRKGGFINNIMSFFGRMSSEESLYNGKSDIDFCVIGSKEIYAALESVSEDVYYEDYVNKILEISKDDAPKIRIEGLTIKENQQGKFQSSEIKKEIRKKYPYYKGDEGQKTLKALFPDGYSFSKDEIKKKVDKYNKEIKEEE